MTISVKEKVKLGNLAQKNTFVLLVLTLLFTPVTGYAYTGKYLSLVVTVVALGGAINLVPDSEIDPVGFYVIVCWYVFSLIENYFAINNARNKLVNDSLDASNQSQDKTDNNQAYFGGKNKEDIQILLLKFIKQKREVTLADCILETGMTVQKIKPVLEQMAKDELIAVSNRLGDSVVVYRSI
ncbi:MAG: hypothetical protein ACRCU2_19515 [Planktothrix sp.]